MDGTWSNPSPQCLSLPDAASPVVLILPEASVISPIVSERGGHPIHYDRIATFDMLNFCETARAEDAHLALPEDLLAELVR